MRSERLYPSKKSGRYYVLTVLRIVNELIVKKHIDAKKKMLDFGCGNMPYKAMYSEKCEYLGVDFEGNKDADLYLVDEKIPLPENAVDYIISTQVLEHVESPEAYLSECFRVLKNDGKLFLSTHGYWKYHPDPTDFWRWTRDGLYKTMELNGFKVSTSYGIMGLSASGLQLFQDGFAPKLHPKLRPTFFRFIAWLQERIDGKRIDNKDASVYYLIAEKK